MIHNIKAWFKAAMRGAKRAQANARDCHDGWLGTFGWHSYLHTFGWHSYLQKERAVLKKDKGL